MDEPGLYERVKAERYGPVTKSIEFGRTNLINDIFQLAFRCELTGADLAGRIELKHGRTINNLTDEELWSLLKDLKKLHASLNDFNCNHDYQDPQIDERTAHEIEWDNAVLHKDEVWGL